MYRSESTGDAINPEWLRLRWPAYWHYDVLQGLRAVTEAGFGGDDRAGDAVDHLRAQRGADGKWRAKGQRHWRLKGDSNGGIIDWGEAADGVNAAWGEGIWGQA